MDKPPVIPAKELDQHLPGAVFLDVRRPEEVAETGTIPGAVLIPIDELPGRLSELPRDRPIISACNGGGRGVRAAALLQENGFQVAGSSGLRHYAGKRVKP